MKSFSCRDVGADCNWTCKASTEQEALRLAESHAKKEHPNVQFDDALKNKTRQQIKDAKTA